jgi:putative transposase
MTVAKALPTDLIDSLLSGYKKPEDLIGENGLLKQLTKASCTNSLFSKPPHSDKAEKMTVSF